MIAWKARGSGLNSQFKTKVTIMFEVILGTNIKFNISNTFRSEKVSFEYSGIFGNIGIVYEYG